MISCGSDIDMLTDDERVRKACEITRELKIPDEKTLPVLKKLLQENGENWNLIKLDNYTALIDAIYSLDEEEEEEDKKKKKKQTETSSNGSSRGKSHVINVFDSPHSAALKKQSQGSSNRGKSVDSPATLKRKYETRSAKSGSSSEEGVQKQSQTSDGVRKKRYKAIIRDITKGSESVEISLVDEVGSEQVPKFTYIPHNIVYQNAYLHVSLARISDDDCCASCNGDCLSADFPCACARETSGEYAYTKEGLVREEFLDTCIKMKKAPDTFSKFYCQVCPLERDNGKCEGHLIRKFIKECWRKCGCDMMCGNRVVQRGIRCQLQVYFTQEGKGWGIRTLQDLPKGTFVFEYIGEILTNTELYERNIRSTSERHTYPVTLDADWGSEKDLKDEEALCLDATICGNVARFVNHRCEDANLIDIPVQIETPDRHYYHIAFFTIRDVKAMDELTWDYLIDFHDESHPVKAFKCCCGSELCRDKMPKGSGGKSGERRKVVPAKKQAGEKIVLVF
ncbi:Histone-lysine N-methyltransferase SUVR4 [Raphanus sativus]|nr:Histone-lysine N-methyltransferase SUVR4 [Raphanus sativus]